MKTLSEIIAEQIRTRRKAMGLSQLELAGKINVGHMKSVSQWETQAFLPNAVNLCALADVFECNVDELLGRK
jgi:transcriptional regulator with XRE-family HTH domain